MMSWLSSVPRSTLFLSSLFLLVIHALANEEYVDFVGDMTISKANVDVDQTKQPDYTGADNTPIIQKKFGDNEIQVKSMDSFDINQMFQGMNNTFTSAFDGGKYFPTTTIGFFRDCQKNKSTTENENIGWVLTTEGHEYSCCFLCFSRALFSSG